MPTVSQRPAGRISQTHTGRREFLGLLGAGATASVARTGPTQAQSSPVVTMHADHFDPVGLHVEPGTTVRFEIESGSHTVTAYEDRVPTAADAFDSGRLSDGAFEQTFDTPGTYDYYCRPHRSSGMVGRIVVGEPGGPAEASPIPDGAVPDSETIVDQGTVGIDDGGDTEGDPAGERNHGGMGMSGPGGMGWMLLMPIGFLVVVLGLVGSVIYWASRRASDTPTQHKSAIAVLERRYARGELDDEEYERRRDELDTND